MPIQRYNRAIPKPGHERRKKYENDPEYRERAKNSSRRTYRRKNDVELQSCLHSLQFLDALASECEVTVKGSESRTYMVLNVHRTSQALQVIYQTVWRWIKTEMIPTPVLVSVSRQRNVHKVYHIDEVRAFIEIIGEHQRTVRYYRREHADIRDKINERIAAVRRDLDI